MVTSEKGWERLQLGVAQRRNCEGEGKMDAYFIIILEICLNIICPHVYV